MALDSSITFKCDEPFKTWLAAKALEMDKPASEIIRTCCVIAMPLVESIRGLDRVSLEDIKSPSSVCKF